jgi:serine/threonine protein kinase
MQGVTAEITDGATPPARLLGGRYRLGAVLGQGGMGVVYSATQESLARPIAIKLLQPALAQHADAVARFRAEAERAGRLAHPHIVQILDFGHEPDGSAWIAMELLQGEPLSARIAAGPMSEAEVVRVALETLSALEAAHAASLVHRDLKPDNIFLTKVPGIGASVKVLDFGIAKLLDDANGARLTATGALVGTPLYMSPEQARGTTIDARSDLYSLGALLYEALTLHPPFTGATYPALILSVMTDTPRPIAELRPEITPALAAVITRAMDRDPSARFASATEMATALRAIAPSDSVPTLRGAKDLAIAMAATVSSPAPVASTPPTRLSPPSALVEPVPPLAKAPHGDAKAPLAPSTSAGPSQTMLAAIGGAVATLAIVAIAVRIVQPPPAPPATAEATPREDSARSIDVDTPTRAHEVAEPQVMQPMEPPAPPTIGAATAASPPATTEPRRIDEPPSTTAAVPDDPAIRVAVARARRGFTPRVQISSLQYAGMSSSADLRGPIEAAGGWARCWPREIPPPTESRGRDFLLDIAADGHPTNVAPAPQSEEPAAFARCMSARLMTLTFPPPARGTAVQVRVGFAIED